MGGASSLPEPLGSDMVAAVEAVTTQGLGLLVPAQLLPHVPLGNWLPKPALALSVLTAPALESRVQLAAFRPESAHKERAVSLE